ncbi:MAG: RNA pseudouridine synthase [Candidatus Lambdaproteobacteria bacterium RIFOXYD1_FULL_56_27]|uniref:RNA pseudouridine synthase n=1 Tax=Candidatus Lambdaproteobacteria bacterium RIFOXYD2_FULL_56_26 TaxID=1817773 RepID=A0A1F6GL85_9PROT|nr:MAG: RNA pseudouridine synthase [Candidatus Lambdaproteobacteria bacterium RIFOXYD2_FULL_56_26]OGH03599.1 MAG: RNA pseudouridine synthase [Candidatus Lambdaproteobacteria bacterium RIFOXYC1_FULL_56_13]OGH08736.1 MAG: RNA pseudouridine synthase [Candidatus Lambdaproteobacteria bacterium RIFOXYD1_FULL_56_27]
MSLPIRRRHQPKGITILYDDKDIMVVDKAPGLLTIGTDKERLKTAYALLTDYVKKGSQKSKARLFIVHRLDQDTSGVLVFAKTEAAKITLQSQWDQNEKKYLALAHGHFTAPAGEFRSYLTENQALRVYSTPDTSLGKLSVTEYKVIEERQGLSLLELRLVTGRKHQIRVHLAEAGHPIYGDKRYGQGDKEAKRLGLHAKSIAFAHPTSGEPQFFETKTPGFFQHMMGR